MSVGENNEGRFDESLIRVWNEQELKKSPQSINFDWLMMMYIDGFIMQIEHFKPRCISVLLMFE